MLFFPGSGLNRELCIVSHQGNKPWALAYWYISVEFVPYCIAGDSKVWRQLEAAQRYTTTGSG